MHEMRLVHGLVLCVDSNTLAALTAWHVVLKTTTRVVNHLIAKPPRLSAWMDKGWYGFGALARLQQYGIHYWRGKLCIS